MTREQLVEKLDYVVKMARQYEAAVIRVPEAVHGADERLEQAKRELLASLSPPSDETLRGAFCDLAKMSVLTERLEAHVKIARDANLTKVTLFTDLLAEATDLIASLSRTAEPSELPDPPLSEG